MNAAAVCGELLRSVRRQHRSLAHARQPDYDLARPSSSERAHHARRLRRRYNYNEQKGPGVPTGDRDAYGPGPNFLDLYVIAAICSATTLRSSRNDFGFGYTLAAPGEHQRSVPLHAGERDDSYQRLRQQPATRSRDRELLRSRYVEPERQVLGCSAASGCSGRSTRPRRTSIHASR